MATGDHAIWSGWLSVAIEESNRWKKRFFRLTLDALEYYDADPNELSSGLDGIKAALSRSVSEDPDSSRGTRSELDVLRSEDKAHSDSFSSSFQSEFLHSNANDDTSSTTASSIEAISGAPSSPTISLFNDDQLARIDEHSSQAAQGKLDLSKIASMCLLSDTSSQEATGNLSYDLFNDCTEECGRLHKKFHNGLPMLILMFSGKESNEYASKMWRIEFLDEIQAENVLYAIGDAIRRTVVRGAGWMHTQGTISWNKRYVLLLSTGNLLVFKDPSLKNLRRNITLGSASAIQPTSPIPQAASVMESEILSLLSENSLGYRDYTGIKILHPDIPEKRGYILYIPPLADMIDSLQHYCIFKEWLRLLRVLGCEANIIGKLLMTLDGSCKHRMMRMKLLRESEKAELPLRALVSSESYRVTPAIKVLARSGFSQELRSELWAGFFCNSHSNDGSRVKAKKNEMSVFNVQLDPDSDSVREKKKRREILVSSQMDYLSFMQKKSCGRSMELLKLLVWKHPQLDISPALLSISYTVVQSMLGKRKCWVEESALSTFEAIVMRRLSQYHQYSSAYWKPFGVNKKDIVEKSTEKTKHDISKLISYKHISIPLQIDVCIFLDILVEYFPVSSVHKCSGRNDIRSMIALWFMSAFTCCVPFPLECGMRLWDVLCTENESSTSNVLIRVALALILVFEPQLSKCESSDEVFEALSSPLVNDTMSPMNVNTLADEIIDRASRHPRLIENASDSSLDKRRSEYSKLISEQASRRMVLVKQWKNRVEDLRRFCNATNELLNQNEILVVRRSTYQDETKKKYLKYMQAALKREIHAKIRDLYGKLIRIDNALRFSQTSLEVLSANFNKQHQRTKAPSDKGFKMSMKIVGLSTKKGTKRSSITEEGKNNSLSSGNNDEISPTSVSFHKYVEMLEEKRGSSDLLILRGPQACVNANVLSELAHAAVGVGWTISGAIWQLLHLNEVISLQNLHYNVRCISSHSSDNPRRNDYKAGGEIDVCKTLISKSLISTSRMLTPLEDLKNTQTIGINIQMKGLFRKLHMLHSNLIEIVRCIADTAAEQNTPGSTMEAPIAYIDGSKMSNIFIKDLFGGHVDVVSKLVPFILDNTNKFYVGLELNANEYDSELMADGGKRSDKMPKTGFVRQMSTKLKPILHFQKQKTK